MLSRTSNGQSPVLARVGRQPCRHAQSDKFFPAAVERAQAMLREAAKDTSRLDGYVWHSNRHTFASRLVMAGVDLLTVKELGGWRRLAMVQRYAHLAPAHLQAAVERLVVSSRVASPDPQELRENFDSGTAVRAGVR
jgi:integrase